LTVKPHSGFAVQSDVYDIV